MPRGRSPEEHEHQAGWMKNGWHPAGAKILVTSLQQFRESALFGGAHNKHGASWQEG